VSPIVDYTAWCERRRANDDLEALASRSVCGVCGAGLYTPLVDGVITPRCSRDPAHKGMATPQTVMEAYRQGLPMDLATQNAIDARRRKRNLPVPDRTYAKVDPKVALPPMTAAEREKAEREMKELFG